MLGLGIDEMILLNYLSKAILLIHNKMGKAKLFCFKYDIKPYLLTHKPIVGVYDLILECKAYRYTNSY